MRSVVRCLLVPAAALALVALPACSSSKPAQQPASTTAAPTRGDADVMRTADATSAATVPTEPTPAGQPVRTRVVMPGGPGGDVRNMTPEQRTERRLMQLTEALALSTEQQARIRPVLLADALESPRMRREDMANMTQEQMMAMAQQQQERRARINGLIEARLTPAQVTQFRTMMQQERERMMEQGRRMMGGSGQ